MGSAMARNLVAAGLRTTVWDRSPGATAPLATAGALVATSPQDAIADARVVITMLPTADAVNSVIRTHGLNAFARGAVWAQMGTIGVAATAGLENTVSQLRPDVLFVDAPVSGSKGPAEAGQLLILASGPPAAEAIVQPVFSAIGRKTVWLGQAGQGSSPSTSSADAMEMERGLAGRCCLPAHRSRSVLPGRHGRTCATPSGRGQPDLPNLPGADTVPDLGTRPGQLLGHLGRHHRG